MVKSQLNKLQAANKIRGLVAPAPTRWGAIKACFESLEANEALLNSIASGRDFTSGANQEARDKRLRIKATITDYNFVGNLQKAISIVAPIDEIIKYFQSDRVPISDVYAFFNKLPAKFRANDLITSDKQEYLVTLLDQRFEFLYGDAHGVAYLLDPRYLEDGIDEVQNGDFKDTLENFINNFPPNDEEESSQERKTQMCKEYVAFVINSRSIRQKKTVVYQSMVSKDLSVLDFWLTTGTRWPLLRELALKVFNLVASSAASERNFSTTGFIHSKL